ncbi:hypothetical protein F2P56_033115 [Juglans regia]|uniref:Uncharacterized protein n=1 Tax=Juglans regia TaxID=51240 RepID=A0A833TIQ2_JUGRE|nr:hypothetical protein F2P56_033115 [Juglans regia]
MSNSDPKPPQRPGPWPPAPESSAMPPSSWAKRTGFKPKFSGETNASDSGQVIAPPPPQKPRETDPAKPDLEMGRVRAVNGERESEKVVPPTLPQPQPQPQTDKDRTVKKRRDSEGPPKISGPNGQAQGGPAEQASRRPVRSDAVVDVLPQSVDDDDGFVGRHMHMKYELRDTPGLVPIGLYGFQHFTSMLGSLILVPLVIVPAMGGTYCV